MSFLPDIIKIDTLEQMSDRMAGEFNLDKSKAQQALADTLGFSDWTAMQLHSQRASRLAVIANPQPQPSTAWFSKKENRHLLWNLWAMLMRVGVSHVEALPSIKQSLIDAGHGGGMEDAIDYITNGIECSEKDLGSILAEAVAPYDKDEAARLMVLPMLGSFPDALGQLGGSSS